MTREEILLNSIWVEGKLNVYSDFFEKEIRIELFPSENNLRGTNEIFPDKMVQTVNDFLALSSDYKPLMKELLYKHCQDCCEETSYGFDLKEGETETEANFREFGVKDEDSAFQKANFHHALISEDSLRKNRFVKIVFYPDWEEEHGCELIIKNGELLDYYGESGSHLAIFDN